MLAKFHQKALAVSCALLFAGAASAAQTTESATDMGLAAASQPANVTLMLKLRHEDQLEQLIRQTVTPGNPHYHRFLTTRQFAERFGATDAQIAGVQAYLKQQGLRGQVMDNRMAIRVQGSLAQLGQAFGTTIHAYKADDGRMFHRPATRPMLPAALAGTVTVVSGLSNERQFISHRIKAPKVLMPTTSFAPQSLHPNLKAAAGGNPTATGIPGSYTVGDAANFYNINPLYDRGITGKGSTIGIVTLSNFDPADAEAYWDGIGLVTKPHRITQVHVNGGGAINGGSGETALDVEQSGGLAPNADILVYDAPNTSGDFVAAFAQAVSDNLADSISTSWGLPEIYNFAALNVAGADVSDTTDVGDLRAFHQIFLEAAVQGQSVFAASGDSGAYDTVRGLGHGDGPGEFSAPLTVDSPASDPYITAAGGTTVPFSYSFSGGPVESIKRESVWGWDYLQNYFDTHFGPGLIDLFSVGGGGGVSVYWETPFYQRFTHGIRRSEKHQALVYNDPEAGPTTLAKLPGHFRGRNVPDISLNADPETGYLVVSSTDGGVVSSGGTSFVAPQLNGVSALLTQSLGHRVGFWNPQVYFLQNVFGYGRYSAFNSVRDGDNWFYQGKPHYTPGTGIGTLDVANLDAFLRLF
ncbi:S8/S53 family peptidase [Frateuria sp. MAH-13]|uniref:S8/S53 family peptidase n=1 Tax=Frateuria flava TaxID=2821489 RepID=A0ABS4DKQ4_9GAMM|nr:S53 family peptidase [Frateuria flava]MBP1473636.1 S8/S53 family peptidase [Frateuria flava]